MGLRKSDVLFGILHEKYGEILETIQHGTLENPNNLSFVYCNTKRKGDNFIKCINDTDESCEFCVSRDEGVIFFFEYPNFVISKNKKIKFFEFWLENMRECRCMSGKFCRDCRKLIRKIQEDIKFS